MMENEEPTCPRCGSTEWTITGFSSHSTVHYSHRLRCKRDTGRRDYQVYPAPGRGKPILCGACWPIRGELQNFPAVPGEHFRAIFPKEAL